MSTNSKDTNQEASPQAEIKDGSQGSPSPAGSEMPGLTIEQAISIAGGSPEDWARHPNGGGWGKSPLYIQGSRHACGWAKKGIIKIGCEAHDVEHWIENHVRIGAANGYSKDEIREYKLHIDLFAALRREASAEASGAVPTSPPNPHPQRED